MCPFFSKKEMKVVRTLSMGHSSSVSEIVIFDTPVVASSLILVWWKNFTGEKEARCASFGSVRGRNHRCEKCRAGFVDVATAAHPVIAALPTVNSEPVSVLTRGISRMASRRSEAVR